MRIRFRIEAQLIAWVIIFSSCQRMEEKSKTTPIEFKSDVKARNIEWNRGLQSLDSRLAELEGYCKQAGLVQETELQQAFFSARHEYKQKEFLWESGFPLLARNLNGPAVDEVERDCEHTVLPAQGFQVFEAALFPERRIEKDSLLAIVRKMRQILLDPQLTKVHWTDSSVVEAVRLELFRLSMLGLSGYDSPLARRSLSETRSALIGMDNILKEWVFPPATIPAVWSQALAGAINDLGDSIDFNEFDRTDFLVRRMVPLYSALNATRSSLGISTATEAFAYSSSTPELFSTSSWDVYFFAPPFSRNPPAAMVELGEKLFSDPILSAHGERSCATCHQPGRSFTDGLAKGLALDGHGRLGRNAPTLLYAGFQNAQFWDERAESLEDQADAVIRNPKEMGGTLDSTAPVLSNRSNYANDFDSAFRDEIEDRDNVITPLRIRRALAAYIRSLAPFNSPWDKYMAGDSTALSQDAKHGFNLFMGKAGCATCHFPPLFNGALPPLYGGTDMEVLGVPADRHSRSLDADSGAYLIDHAPVSLRAFKTPTVRNTASTGPYMHNGVFETLEQVIDFYDAGGGAGLGLPVANQTLSPDSLKLSKLEKTALLQFIHALSDSATLSPGTDKRAPAYMTRREED